MAKNVLKIMVFHINQINYLEQLLTATHNVSLDMLREMVSHNGYKLDALRFIKKYEVEITVTSNKNNKTYKIKN